MCLLPSTHLIYHLRTVVGAGERHTVLPCKVSQSLDRNTDQFAVFRLLDSLVFRLHGSLVFRIWHGTLDGVRLALAIGLRSGLGLVVGLCVTVLKLFGTLGGGGALAGDGALGFTGVLGLGDELRLMRFGLAGALGLGSVLSGTGTLRLVVVVGLVRNLRHVSALRHNSVLVFTLSPVTIVAEILTDSLETPALGDSDTAVNEAEGLLNGIIRPMRTRSATNQAGNGITAPGLSVGFPFSSSSSSGVRIMGVRR